MTEPVLGRELNDPDLIDVMRAFDAHHVELMALVYGTGDSIRRHTAREPNRLLVPATWGVRPEVANDGFFHGKQMLVVDGIDKPMLAYGGRLMGERGLPWSDPNSDPLGDMRALAEAEANRIPQVSASLTDISVAYRNTADSYVADKVFPVVASGRRNGKETLRRRHTPQLWRHDQVPMHEINLATGHHPLVQDILDGYLHVVRDLGERLDPIDLEEWAIEDDYGDSRSGYTLLDGRHRFTAHLIAGLPTIWARIKP